MKKGMFKDEDLVEEPQEVDDSNSGKRERFTGSNCCGLKAAWAGKSEETIRQSVKHRKRVFVSAEADALTSTQCLWVMRHCLDCMCGTPRLHPR